MVERMRETDGFRLAGAFVGEDIRAVAGYRTLEMLYCGRILSIDDLVTAEDFRSHGLGKLLLNWLKDRALQLGCFRVHLDSRLVRAEAHRFYQREGFSIPGYHIVAELAA
jgi:GNAT superfamily N-acetyltransferase